MEQEALKAAKREAIGSSSARRIRNQGMVPAVLYGHGREVVHLALPGDDVTEMIESGHHLVTLDIDGASESALIKQIQWDTWSRDVLHVDFSRVRLDEEVTVSVEIRQHGQPKEVESGAVLEQPLHSIEVICKANAIPDEIVVEVGEMQLGDAIHVRDLPLPPGVKTEIEPDAVVITLQEARGVEEEEAEEAAEALVGEESAEPEVIGKGGKEEEQEGEEPAEQA